MKYNQIQIQSGIQIKWHRSSWVAPFFAPRSSAPFFVACGNQRLLSVATFVVGGTVLRRSSFACGNQRLLSVATTVLPVVAPFFPFFNGNGDNLAEIVSPTPILGNTKITASLAADHVLTLSVNDKVVAQKKGVAFVPRQPAEDFCLGHDNEKPVAIYSAKEPFKGQIKELKITSP